jgi:hypothetical protein
LNLDPTPIACKTQSARPPSGILTLYRSARADLITIGHEVVSKEKQNDNRTSVMGSKKREIET